jgi:hypothetical protein
MGVLHWTMVGASALLTIVSTYACGGSSGTTVPNGTAAPFETPAPVSGDPSTAAGAGGEDAGSTATGAATSTPARCDILQADAGRGPDIDDACRACVTQTCCTPIVQCYGGAPATAGTPGADGVKTACALFGECEALCATGDGGVTCDSDCELTYGAGAAAAWTAADTCLYGAPPGGCAGP